MKISINCTSQKINNPSDCSSSLEATETLFEISPTTKFQLILDTLHKGHTVQYVVNFTDSLQQ